MVKQGDWTPVSQSKWATPLVPVPKKDGGVRICGDYKPTVNTQIEIAHHPLPTVELITSKLSTLLLCLGMIETYYSCLVMIKNIQQLSTKDRKHTTAV